MMQQKHPRDRALQPWTQFAWTYGTKMAFEYGYTRGGNEGTQRNLEQGSRRCGGRKQMVQALLVAESGVIAWSRWAHKPFRGPRKDFTAGALEGEQELR